MKYRAEIDGLRALAVLPVVLFHAGIQGFEGGFVGVDIFFVISGFLITRIIATDLDAGRFSIADFYERRARRILPALFFVIACSLPVAWWVLLPNDAKDFAQSISAVTVFSSNLLFWRETEYFAVAAELKPLLHTWSLAVEEQFYVLFPLFMLAVWRWGRRHLAWWLGAAAIASFILAVWTVNVAPTTAFFLAPTRAWELLLGAIVATTERAGSGSTTTKLQRELGGAAGLGLILLSIAFAAEQSPFPGLPALLPTVGAALVIMFSTTGTITGRLLSARPFVFLGLLSYSFYLWHQPLLAFVRHWSVGPPSTALVVSIVAAALLLSYLTWRFIETPARARHVVSARAIALGGGTAAVLLFLVGVAGHVTDGAVISRLAGPAATDLETRLRPSHGIGKQCDSPIFDERRCSSGRAPTVLLWGDSYAMHLYDGIISADPTPVIAQATLSGCAPIIGIGQLPRQDMRLARQCIEFNDAVVQFLRSAPTIRYVVMSSKFSGYVAAESEVLDATGHQLPARKASAAAFLRTIAVVREMGKIPVVFSPPPRDGSDIGRCLVRASVRDAKKLSECDLSRSDVALHDLPVTTFLHELGGSVDIVHLDSAMCDAARCYASVAGVLMYRDNGHLSHEGSAYLGKTMRFNDILRRAERARTQEP